jgi:hypothetical protein
MRRWNGPGTVQNPRAIGVHRRLISFRYVRTDMPLGKEESQPPMNADERK